MGIGFGGRGCSTGGANGRKGVGCCSSTGAPCGGCDGSTTADDTGGGGGTVQGAGGTGGGGGTVQGAGGTGGGTTADGAGGGGGILGVDGTGGGDAGGGTAGGGCSERTVSCWFCFFNLARNSFSPGISGSGGNSGISGNSPMSLVLSARIIPHAGHFLSLLLSGQPHFAHFIILSPQFVIVINYTYSNIARNG